MPFKKGVTPKGAKPFEKGKSGNLKGKPKGTLSRATIAKRVLAMRSLLPDDAFNKLQELYPQMKNKLTAEELATIVMISNAITKGDVQAYKAIMDSAYGAPIQENINTDTLKIVVTKKNAG